MKIKTTIWALLIALIVCPNLLFSSSSTQLQVALQSLANEYVSQHAPEEYLTGVAITVHTPSQQTSVFAGHQANDQKVLVNDKTLFQIGSITKSFIAAILLKLESDPRYHFSINDPVTTYFPEYPAWKDITILQLLNMTSGIPDYLQRQVFFTELIADPYRNHSLPAWISQMHRMALLFPPGTQFNYSNTNYYILGLLIERLTGKSVSNVMQEMLIHPLSLNSTYYVPHLIPQNLQKNLIQGYQGERSFAHYLPVGTVVTQYSLSYLQAAGGIIASNQDLAKWVKALFTPGQVLSRVQLKKMLSMVSEKDGKPITQLNSQDLQGYGLGTSAQYGPSFKQAFFIYQGMTLGYRAIYVYVPTRKVLIVITVNSSFDGKENHLVSLINHIASLIL
ncbi:MAG: beta-lactamase family protein [Gammaproteobacteria bacterium]|nr:beta-lactamase family protein [Gammaproteobacteria bacterium]